MSEVQKLWKWPISKSIYSAAMPVVKTLMANYDLLTPTSDALPCLMADLVIERSAFRTMYLWR